MNIGLIGSGGREHALCKKMHESKLVKKIVCFPGNAGTSQLATNVEVNILDFKKILSLIKFYKIDLVIVGPEEPLVKGIVDFLEKKKIKVVEVGNYKVTYLHTIKLKSYLSMKNLGSKFLIKEFFICHILIIQTPRLKENLDS